MNRPINGFPDESWTYHDHNPEPALFVGREEEIAILTEAIQRGLNVLVTGSRGSGKTSLVRMVLETSHNNLLKIEWISAFGTTQPEKLIDRIEDAVRRDVLVIVDDLDRTEPHVASRIANSAFRREGGRFIVITSILPAGMHAVAGHDFVHVGLASISEADALLLLEKHMASADISLSRDELTEIVRQADGNIRMLLQSANRVLQRKSDSFRPEPRLILTLNSETLDTSLAVDLIVALNEVYRAFGGEGLEIEDGESREFRMKGAVV